MTLTPDQWAGICAHLTAQLPEEACGLLAGRAGRPDKVYTITNARHSSTHYEMEPAELLRALVEIDDNEWDLQAIFHSHPAGPPVPSPTDVAEAYYPDSAYLIFAPLAGGGWQARAFEIRAGQVRETPVVVEPTTNPERPGF